MINIIPRGIHFKNYFEIFKINGLMDAAMISIERTVIGTAFTVMASAFLGYMFTQQRMWLRKFFYRSVVITMYFSAGLIPMFLTMKVLGLTNNFWVYVIPGIVQPFNIIMVKTYIESIPQSLQEAAEVDGAGILTRFFKIILPTSTPILATIAIWSAVGQWNSFQDTLIFNIANQKLYSLQYLLFTYLNQANSLAAAARGSGSIADVANLVTMQTPTSIRITISVVVILPIIFIYPMFQRYFVKGIMIGSVKG
jgi:multiple sugar transport system permease protein/putative aldouronate transport system permease protein